MNKDKPEMAQPDDRCECGHILKNHVVNVKESMASTQVKAKCKFCTCEDVCIA